MQSQVWNQYYSGVSSNKFVVIVLQWYSWASKQKLYVLIFISYKIPNVYMYVVLVA